MENIFFELNQENLLLTAKTFNDLDELNNIYVFDLDYIYLMEKEMYDEAKKSVYKKEIFVYIINKNKNISKNEIKIDLNNLEDKVLLNVLKNALFVKDKMEKEIIKSEHVFNDFYCLLLENVDEDLIMSMKIENMY